MPVKKPSAKSSKAKKTVSAKAAAKPAAKPAAKAAVKASAKPAAKAATKAPARPWRRATPPPAARPGATSRPPPGRLAAIAKRARRPGAQAHDSAADAYDAGASLLAGPRNVQPYVASKGEQYMSKEQLEHFRHILVAAGSRT